jgi:hypothetical protein
MLSRSTYRALKRMHGIPLWQWEDLVWGGCYVALWGLALAGVIIEYIRR